MDWKLYLHTKFHPEEPRTELEDSKGIHIVSFGTDTSNYNPLFYQDYFQHKQSTSCKAIKGNKAKYNKTILQK